MWRWQRRKEENKITRKTERFVKQSHKIGLQLNPKRCNEDVEIDGVFRIGTNLELDMRMGIKIVETFVYLEVRMMFNRE